MNWTDEPCHFSPAHAPHLWGEEQESGQTPFIYVNQVVFFCDGAGRYDPDE